MFKLSAQDELWAGNYDQHKTDIRLPPEQILSLDVKTHMSKYSKRL